jgi:hypothetical protein
VPNSKKSNGRKPGAKAPSKLRAAARPSTAASSLDVFILTEPARRRGLPVPLRERRSKHVNEDELLIELERARREAWPEMVEECEGFLAHRVNAKKVQGEIERAVRDKRWNDASTYSAMLHARSLPLTPWEDVKWRESLRDKLHTLSGRFAMVAAGAPAAPDYSRLALIGRVLRAVDLAFSQAWDRSRGGADMGVLNRLDKIARPFIRSRATWTPTGTDELDRPHAADELRNLMATHFLHERMFFVNAKNARERKELSRSIVDRFVFTLEASGPFAQIVRHLPNDWREERRVRQASDHVAELAERLLESAKPDFDEIGEKALRSVLADLGYPRTKARSLFDAESKNVKRKAR